MLTVEMGGKSVTTTDDKLIINVNGKPVEINSNDERVYVNNKRVNGWNLPVLEVLGLGVVISLWYTLIFTEYGAQFIMWATGNS